MTARRGLGLLLAVASVSCQAWAGSDGASLFQARCASCHETPGARAPGVPALKGLEPERIGEALRGSMAPYAEGLSEIEKQAITGFLAGRPRAVPSRALRDAACAGATKKSTWSPGRGPSWNGWGADAANTRYQPASSAGIGASEVPKLKLKWAFGFEGDSRASSQPVIVGGRVFVGSFGGYVYALDAGSGCVHWRFKARGGVRGAVSVGEAGKGKAAVFFGDLTGHVYALDASTGRMRWEMRPETDWFPSITGSVKLHDGRLYVPVSSAEEGMAKDPRYECCRFSGVLAALDAATGKVIWKARTIPDRPKPLSVSPIGTRFWGPSGASIWSSPTIDVKRGLVYVGTGNSYSEPPTAAANALIALDLRTGKVRWSRQYRRADVYNLGCTQEGKALVNCPGKPGLDDDFGASPILVGLAGGREILVAGRSSGLIAVDPNRQGEILWRSHSKAGDGFGYTRWGPASDGSRVYVAASTFHKGEMASPTPRRGGVFAFNLSDGKPLWQTLSPFWEGGNFAQKAAVTVIPGVVFSGATDGHLRAYSAEDGRLLWDFDTNRQFESVNGVDTRGGSMDGAGPSVASGMVFVTSGYNVSPEDRPGNALLAFAP